MENITDIVHSNSIVKVKPYTIVKYNNRNIILVPSSGAWVIGGDSILSILDRIKDGLSYSELEGTIEELPVIIKTLYFSGIISIDNKCATDKIVDEEKAKCKEVRPKLLVLKYTNHCNLRCSYCYAYKEDTFNKSLSYEDLEKAVELVCNSFEDDITVVFHGGEPLLRFNDIKHDVNALLKKFPRINFSIQTNATLVTDEIASFLKEYKFSIGTSLDGYNEHCNSLRCFPQNIPSYQNTINGIKCLFKHGNNPSASIVVTRTNKDGVIDTMQSLMDLGVRHFVVMDYFPAGRGKGKKDNLALSTDEAIKLRKELLLFINDHNKREPQNWVSERKILQLVKKIVYWRSMYMCSESPCGAGRRMLALGADGNLYPCDEFISNDKEFVINHVSNITDLKEALRNSPSVTKCYAHRIENISKCSKCIWRNICEFHCAGNSFYFNGELNQPSSLCEYFQKMIPLTMELLYEGRIDARNIL